VVDGKWVTSYTHQWNFTVERELLKDTRLRMAYVGTQSTHLKGEYDQNAPIYNPNRTLAQNRATIDDRRPIEAFPESTGSSMVSMLRITHCKFRWTSVTAMASPS